MRCLPTFSAAAPTATSCLSASRTASTRSCVPGALPRAQPGKARRGESGPGIPSGPSPVCRLLRRDPAGSAGPVWSAWRHRRKALACLTAARSWSSGPGQFLRGLRVLLGARRSVVLAPRLAPWWLLVAVVLAAAQLRGLRHSPPSGWLRPRACCGQRTVRDCPAARYTPEHGGTRWPNRSSPHASGGDFPGSRRRHHRTLPDLLGWRQAGYLRIQRGREPGGDPVHRRSGPGYPRRAHCSAGRC